MKGVDGVELSSVSEWTIIGDEAGIWSPMTASTHFHDVARKGLSLCETERSVYVVWGSVITW